MQLAAEADRISINYLFADLALYGTAVVSPQDLAFAIGAAVYWENVHQVQRLLAAGAAVNHPLKDDHKTALHIAVSKGHASIVAVLLDAGADVNAADDTGLTALHMAAEDGRGDIVKLLIAAAADVSATDSSSCSPLHFAVASTNRTVVQMLLDAGTVVNAADVDGQTALHVAAKGVTAVNDKMLQQLLAARADVHAVNNQGRTALHLAVANGGCSEQFLQVLLTGGANPAAADLSGLTVLEYAARRDSSDIMQLLLQAYDVPAAVLQRAASVAASYRNYQSFETLVGTLLSKDAAAAEAVVAAMPDNDFWKSGWLAAQCGAEVAVQQQQAALAAEKQEIERMRVAVQHLVIGLATMTKMP